MKFKLLSIVIVVGLNANYVISTPNNGDGGINNFLSSLNIFTTFHNPGLLTLAIVKNLNSLNNARTSDKEKNLKGSEEPGFEMEKPMLEKKEPGFEMEKSMLEKKEPGFEMEKSMLEKKEPGFEMEKSMLEKKEPGFEMEKPMLEKKEPGFEMEKSMLEIEKPVTSPDVEEFKKLFYARLEERINDIIYVEKKIYEWIKQRNVLTEEEEADVIRLFQYEKRGLGVLDVHEIMEPCLEGMHHVTDIKLYDPFMHEFKKYVDLNVTKTEKYIKDLTSLEITQKHPNILLAAQSLNDRHIRFLGYFDDIFHDYWEILIYMNGKTFAERD
ncbi:hypothetical protein BdWA1_001508 [Babesia duncani]|uniref:Uncharacterized protein n=1 Tax=Babesia duncani TaxID=323732 RepID=A0AAD9PKK6_9APIC|nr:hypothetical protein BdWA1_001508 [Babesia duncani]